MLARAEQTPHDEIGVSASPAAYGALPDAVPHEPPMLRAKFEKLEI